VDEIYTALENLNASSFLRSQGGENFLVGQSISLAIHERAGKVRSAAQFTLWVCDIDTERHVILAKESQLATSRVIVEVGHGWRIGAARRHIRSKRPAYALIAADRIASYREQPKRRWRQNAHTTGATGTHPQFVLRSIGVKVQNNSTVITRRQDVLKIDLVSTLVVTSAYQFNILPDIAGRWTCWLRTVDCLIGSYVNCTNCLSCAALTVKVKPQLSAGDAGRYIRIRRRAVLCLVGCVKVVASFEEQRSRGVVVMDGHGYITAWGTGRCCRLSAPRERADT